jgi:hypothetical protein
VELTVTLAYVLLAVAAVALVVFFVTWSRRSKPTDTQPEPHPRRGDLDHTVRESRDPNVEA